MPNLPLSRRHAVVVAAAAIVLLLLGGRLLLHAGGASTAVPPSQPLPVPGASVSAAEVVVDVVGAVRHPGLYRMRQGDRIADAVARAGGPRKADLALINLAAPLADGEQVVVPRRGLGAAATGAGGAGGTGAPSASSGPVHLNTATLEQLDSLPGIGPVTAQKILDYRQKHGAFSSVDELDAVPGIGPARLDQLRDLVAP
ncbi:MAG: ComEA family DNA-binding protein [Gaiellaceae bacterium]